MICFSMISVSSWLLELGSLYSFPAQFSSTVAQLFQIYKDKLLRCAPLQSLVVMPPFCKKKIVKTCPIGQPVPCVRHRPSGLFPGLKLRCWSWRGPKLSREDSESPRPIPQHCGARAAASEHGQLASPKFTLLHVFFTCVHIQKSVQVNLLLSFPLLGQFFRKRLSTMLMCCTVIQETPQVASDVPSP